MKIMRNIIILTVLILSLPLSKANLIFAQNDVTITGIVKLHKPYCGGAYPPPDIAKGTFSAMQNTMLHIVKKGDTSRTEVLSFKTDEKGYFKFKIKKGSYYIFSDNKMLPFEEFYKKNSQQVGNSVSMGKDCYKKWYDTPDYKLEVAEDSKIEIIFHSSCFTGINPCLQYTGPWPQ